MVVTIEDVTKIQPKEQTLIARIEQDIDAALMRSFDPVDSRMVTFAKPNGYTGRVKREIELKYSVAGWDIELQSDQRDGDYLKIAPKKRSYVDMRETSCYRDQLVYLIQ